MKSKINQLIRRLVKIALQNPRDLKHILGVTNWAAGEIVDPVVDIRSIPSVDLFDICLGTRWTLQSLPDVRSSISPLECAALAALSHAVTAKKVFEFGTYKGVSTTQLALNIAVDGMVFTLDLPEENPAYSLPIPRLDEQEITFESGKGTLVPHDLLDRVTFLKSDSAHFDETPYLGSMDLVFVDGAHSYEYVKNDTEKGWRMLRHGGILAWHDCAPHHKDVVKYIKKCGLKLNIVKGTALAFSRKE
jgi:predicted O-methyltransferase YrrM